jgi:hypothetical protein
MSLNAFSVVLSSASKRAATAANSALLIGRSGRKAPSG